MSDKANKPEPTIEAAKPASAPTTPPRHDPVPAPVAAEKAPAESKPVAAKPKLSIATPAKAEPAAPKPTIAREAAPTPTEDVKRKRGRPLGSKSKTVAKAAPAKAPVAKAPIAKTSATKTSATKAAVAKPAAAKPAIAAKPASNKPVSAKPIKIPTKPVAPRAAAISSEGPKTMTDTITKIQDAAKKFTGDAGARSQAMFGDFSGRAKGAYEKSAKLTEEFTEFQKGNVEALVESSKLAAKAAETLGQGAADYARKSYETGTAAFKTFASAKSPTELFKLQSDYVKSYFDSAVAEGTKLTESWLKLAGDVAQPLSNRVAVAVEKVKATAAI